MRESGFLTTPIGLTNTHSVGVVRDALIAVAIRRGLIERGRLEPPGRRRDLGRTLNDINGFHVKPEHVFERDRGGDRGAVAEGNVGGGTGMICHGFKGGIGTASRGARGRGGGYTVGVLVQANYGARERLRSTASRWDARSAERIPVAGAAPHRRRLDHRRGRDRRAAPSAPVRPASRSAPASASARLGGPARTRAATSSSRSRRRTAALRAAATQAVDDARQRLDRPLFYAAIEATEEAIVNALVAGRDDDMTQQDGLEQAHAHAVRFLDGLDGRPVAPRAGLDELRAALAHALPDHGVDPRQVLDDLVRGARRWPARLDRRPLLRLGRRGALPAAVAADWLASAWDQNAAIFATSPAASVVEEVCGSSG